MDDGARSDGSWWRTLPGMLTAAAAIITAVTDLVVALHQSGLLGGGDREAPRRPPSEARIDPTPRSQPPASSPPSAREANAARGSSAPAAPRTAPRPWSEAKAVITSTEGIVRGISAESLGNCISSNKELALNSGQSIAFDKMRSFEFVRDGAAATLVITLLNGDTVKGTMKMSCDLVGQNELGRVSVLFEKLERVDFER